MLESETGMPEWAIVLVDLIGGAIEFKGMALLEARHSAPAQSAWGVDLIEVAPALREVTEAEGDEAAEGYGIIHSFDLMAAQRAFGDVTALILGTEEDGPTAVTVQGRVGGREVVVIVYTSPFPDAELACPDPDGEYGSIDSSSVGTRPTVRVLAGDQGCASLLEWWTPKDHRDVTRRNSSIPHTLARFSVLVNK